MIKKKFGSRGMALMLVLSMLMQFVPAIPVANRAAAAELKTITLDFNKANLTTTKVKDATVANDGWAVSADTDDTSAAIYSGLDAGNLVFQGVGLKLNLGSSTTGVYWQIGFEFNVEAPGYYDLSMVVSQSAGFGSKSSVILKSPAADGSGENSATLGLLDASTGTTGAWEDITPNPSFSNVYLSAGVNTIIIRSGTSGGRNYMLLKSMTFTQVEPEKEAVISAEDSSVVTYVGKYMHTKLSSTVDGAEVDLGASGNIPAARSVDESIAKASVVTANGVSGEAYTGAFLKIEGVKAGNTNVIVTDASGMAAAIIPVTVSPITAPDKGQVIDFTAAKWADATIAANNWCLDTETMSTSEAKNFSTYSGDFASARLNAGDTAANENQFIAVKFYVEEDGLYAPTITGNKVANHGAEVDVYIDGTNVGSVDFKHSSDAWSNLITNTYAKTELKKIALDKGEHTLRLVRKNAETSRHNTVYITSMILGQKGVSLTAADESVSAYAGYKMHTELTYVIDGVGVNITSNEYDLTVTSDNESVAKASVVVGNSHPDRTFLCVEGVSAGTANITVSESVGGGRLTVPVTVSKIKKPVIGKVLDFGAVNMDAATIAVQGWRLKTEDMATSEANSYRLTSGSQTNIKLTKTGDDKLRPDTQFLSIEFSVNSTGKYIPSIYVGQVGNHGVAADVYLDGVKIGSIDCSHPSRIGSDNIQNPCVSYKFAETELSEGNHTLKLVRTNNVSSRYNWLYLKSVMLEKVSTNFTLIPEMSVAKLGKGETIRMSVTSKLSGTVVDLTNKLTATSEDDGIAAAKAVYEGGKAYVEIEAISEGITNINLLAQEGEDSASFTIPVLVTAEQELVLHAQEPGVIGLGIERDIAITGTINNLVVDLTGAEITAKSTNEEVVTAEVVRKGGAVAIEIFTLSEGEEEIEVDVKSGDKTASVVIPISVSASASSSAMYSVNFKYALAPADATLEEHGFRINFEETSPILYTDEHRALNWRAQTSSGLNAHFEKGDIVAVDFEIPADGYYDVSVMGGVYAMWGINAGYTIDDTYVGTFNYSSPDDAGEYTTTTVDMNCMYLTKGLHTLKVERLNGGTYRHAYMYMEGLNFTPSSAMPTIAGIKLESGKPSLAIGESAQLTSSVIMTNGKTYYFAPSGGEDSFALENLNIDVLSLSGSTVTAKSAGIGRIGATAEINGETMQAEQNIIVNNGKTIVFNATALASPSAAKLDVNGWRVNMDETSSSIYTTYAGNYKVESPGKATGCLKGQMLYNDIYALDFEVESDGAYAMSAVVNQVGNFGATVAAYVDGKYVGQMEFMHPSDNAANSAYGVYYALNAVELAQGEHTLQLKRISGGSYRHDYVFLYSVTLESIGTMPVFDEIRVDVDSNIKIIDRPKAEISVMMSNGREYNFGPLYDGSADPDNCMISIASSDPNVFTIDAAGNITPKAVGEAEIIVSARIDGVTHTKRVPIKIEHEFSITSNPESMELERSVSDTAVLSISYDGQAADLSKVGELTAVADNGELVDVVVFRDESGISLQFTGKMTGATTVRVSTSYEDGTIGQLSIPVVVLIPKGVSDSLVIDFTDGSVTTPDQAKYTANGWELDSELTSDTLAGRANYAVSASNGFNVEMSAVGEQAVLDFRVPNAGDYAVEVDIGQVGNYGATIAYYIDGVYIGESDFSHPSDDPNLINKKAIITLNSLNLRAGRHTLTIKRINTDGSRHSITYLHSVAFKLLSEPAVFDRVEIKADKSVMSVGETSAYTVAAVMVNKLADGGVEERPYRFEAADAIKLTNDNAAAIKVDSANGKLSAAAAGIANLEASASVDGETKTGKLTVKVDEQKLESVEAKIKSKYLFVGADAELIITPCVTDGRAVSVEDVKIDIENNSPDVISVNGTTLTGIAEGEAALDVSVTMNGETVKTTVSFRVVKDGINEIIVSAIPRVIEVTHEGTQIKVYGETYSGDEYSLDGAKIEFVNNNPEFISVSETGYVTPVAEGTAAVTVYVTTDGSVYTGEIQIIVGKGKTASSYYTPERVEAVRENVEKYTWARSLKNSYVATAEKYLGKEEFLWSQMTTQELPRGYTVGFRWDPEANYCHYCGANLTQITGSSTPWVVDIFNSPWKVQCPECRRQFPTNDFWSFYQLGIRENGGDWSYEQAKQRHAEMFNHDVDDPHPNVGYLKNDLYPEMDEHWEVDEETGEQVLVNAGVKGWGVDDGYGYRTGEYYYGSSSWSSTQMEKTHTYIAAYNHKLYQSGGIVSVIRNLASAYVYSGDERFGRLGAILIDRFADVYPDMTTGVYFPHFSNSDSTTAKGKIVGSIWAYNNATYIPLAYDALYPMMEDAKVIDFLSKKAEQYNMINPKDSAVALRQNSEDGILREVYEAALTANIHGNFGMHQGAVVAAGVVLDTMPESKEMIDWAFRSGEGAHGDDYVAGGNVLEKIVNEINRDGATIESAPNYDSIWTNTMNGIMDYLAGYEGYEAADLYKNPFLVKQMKSLYDLTLNRRTTASVGDSGSTANAEFYVNKTAQITLFKNTKDPEVAQMIYFLNGNTTKDLHYNEFTKDPSSLQQEVQAVIDEYGEYDFDKSVMLPTYGFGILRSGSLYAPGTTSERDTQNSFWLLFSKTGSHGHHSMLNLGINAYGIDMAPDLGYPIAADGGDEYLNWGHGTVAHNTIVVDDRKHPKRSTAADPLHFEDAGKVKVIDVDASDTYTNTDVYRRTVVMVEVSDEVSYGVDFFRVKGGSEHLYSFHSQSDEISDYGGFKYVEQQGGSYQGASIPFKARGFANGFSYFRDVRKARYPKTGEFFVDFKVKDFRNLVNDSGNLHLRMNMLNDFELSEITIAKAEPAQKFGNPKELEYVLARRSGSNLDSLFTTVYQPYDGTPYLRDMAAVNVERADGNPIAADEAVKAVKVTHESGRIDYIVYAANNTVDYVIKDSYLVGEDEINVEIPFRGVVGVCSMAEGSTVIEYSYLCDGTKLGEMTATAAYTGSVVDFTKDLAFDNYINVRFDGDVDLNSIIGRYIRIENSAPNNAFYQIKDAQPGENGTVVLTVDAPLIENVKDATDLDNMVYNYNIAERQWFTIPLSSTDDTAPEFETVADGSAVAGSKYTKKLTATVAEGKTATYSAVSLPRGASFNADTCEITWTPDSNQIGVHAIAIMVSDGTLTDMVTFEVEVHRAAGSVSGGTGNEGSSSETESSGSDTGGGASGGSSSGGESSGEGSTDTGNTGDDSDVGDGVLDVPSEKFIDLGGYDWAKESIYDLVDAGVVNGTSHNTYSPGKNITRADFAILLTRAFGVTEGEGENFADVASDKYYAEELRLAKAAGIVNGVGNNKFNPEGEITRQDMMLMLSRALDAAGKKLSDADHSVLAQFVDAAEISDYAKDAVSRLVKDEIIVGANGRIRPLAQATRAEVAVMLNRILKSWEN